jgi:hypothetical protein
MPGRRRSVAPGSTALRRNSQNGQRQYRNKDPLWQWGSIYSHDEAGHCETYRSERLMMPAQQWSKMPPKPCHYRWPKSLVAGVGQHGLTERFPIAVNDCVTRPPALRLPSLMVLHDLPFKNAGVLSKESHTSVMRSRRHTLSIKTSMHPLVQGDSRDFRGPL